MDKKIVVLLSSYNGERYIGEQIESILSQNDIEVTLLIRDDGSKDRTLDIIEEYCSKCNNIELINRDDKANVGVKESFLSLVRYALENYPDINYFSFSDQDDVWLEDKLSAAINFFSDSDKNILYFSNKTIVDSDLNKLADEHLIYYNDVLEICWGSQAFGCTMIFDRRLAAIVLNGYQGIDLLHDSIFYRVAHITGSKIVFDENAYILYRQHKKNVIGISGSKKTGNNWKGLFSKSECFISNLCAQLLNQYRDSLSKEGRYYLELVSGYKKCVSYRLKLAFDKSARKRSLKLYGIWVGKILLRRL